MATEYKVALVGASSLLAKELKECLTESPLAGASFLLLDVEEAQGLLEQVGDEVTVVQVIGENSFEEIDFTFFAGSEELTRKYWRACAAGGVDGAGYDRRAGGGAGGAGARSVAERGHGFDGLAGFADQGGGSGECGGAGAGAAAGPACRRLRRSGLRRRRCCSRPRSTARRGWMSCTSRR